MLVLTYLFYVTGIIYLVFEIFSLKMIDDYYSFIKKTERTDDDKTFAVIQGGFILSYIGWSMVGLITTQWVLFLILLSVNLFIQFDNKPWMIIRKSFNILLILFIMVNKFHLNITFF